MPNYDDDEDDLHHCGICYSLNHSDETHCGYCGEVLETHGGLHVYVEKNFSDPHMEIIKRAKIFMDEYVADGYKMSLRQLYYQFVANVEDFANTEASYKRLGGIVTDARLAGLLDFSVIEDRGRNCQEWGSQDDPKAVLDDLEWRYSEDFWANQDAYVEVWVEKDALSSVIERPCSRLNVPFMACKGYMSASAQWEAGNRFKAAADQGKHTVLIHLGDHDPSGIDMTRDNKDRLALFVGSPVEVRRVGLNMDQIEKYNPPPNPTKVTDSRAKEYLRKFGHTSWELDALKPSVIADLIDVEVRKFIDADLWNRTGVMERQNRQEIAKISKHRKAVFDFVKTLE
jgi:hypothetical protein